VLRRTSRRQAGRQALCSPGSSERVCPDGQHAAHQQPLFGGARVHAASAAHSLIGDSDD
jgi:hypothetical protein